MITLQNSRNAEVTVLTNNFIDNYMPGANGEFVKVYIYLLRLLSDTSVPFSLEQMADHFFCTERDIIRALKYWEKEKLLTLTYRNIPFSLLSIYLFYHSYLYIPILSIVLSGAKFAKKSGI